MKKSLLIALGLTCGFIYAADNEPKPTPDGGVEIDTTAGGKKTESSFASKAWETTKDVASSLIGSGKKEKSSSAAADLASAIKTGTMAAAGVPPIPPINVNIDVTTNIDNCLRGDTINTVNGEGNTIQNIKGSCNKTLGATGDTLRFTVPSAVPIAVGANPVDFNLIPGVRYDFTFANGKSSSLTAILAISPATSGIVGEAAVYTTRRAQKDIWVERFGFRVEGDLSEDNPIARVRVFPDGKAQLFINSTDGKLIELELNVLNLRTSV